jgi:ABC-type polysaccharide/polyol phosphate export permease
MMLLMGLWFYFIFSTFPSRPGEPAPPMEFFGFFFAFMFIFQLIFTAPSFIAAYALLKKKSWARITSIIAGVLSAMSVPVGTAACVYAFWFFFGDNWKTVYAEGEPVHDGYREHLQLMESQPWSNIETDEVKFGERRQTSPPDWR